MMLLWVGFEIEQGSADEILDLCTMMWVHRLNNVQQTCVFRKGVIIIIFKSAGHPRPLPLFTDDKEKKSLP